MLQPDSHFEIYEFPLPETVSAKYNKFLENISDYSPFQTINWAKIKLATFPNEEIPYLIIKTGDDSQIQYGLIVIKRKLKFGLCTLRCERGPVCSNNADFDLEELSIYIKQAKV